MEAGLDPERGPPLAVDWTDPDLQVALAKDLIADSIYNTDTTNIGGHAARVIATKYNKGPPKSSHNKNKVTIPALFVEFNRLHCAAEAARWSQKSSDTAAQSTEPGGYERAKATLAEFEDKHFGGRFKFYVWSRFLSLVAFDLSKFC
jgi:hypothetical protein